MIPIEPARASGGDAFMRIHNKDGGEVDACGNATRCVGWLLMGETGRGAAAIETNAGLAPLPRRLDLPLGRRLVLHAVTGEPLGQGAHSLEADVIVPGVASGRLVIENAPNAHGDG